jgi:hypothetical protein
VILALKFVVRCPSWRPYRGPFAVKVCDNLVDGVPACVVARYYVDFPFVLGESEADWMVRVREICDVCLHFVRADLYYHDWFETESGRVKCGCRFGGIICFHTEREYFFHCLGCFRFGIKR